MDEHSQEEFLEDDPAVSGTALRPALRAQQQQQQLTLTSFFHQTHPSRQEAEEAQVTSAAETTIIHQEGNENLSEADRQKISGPSAVIWHYFEKTSKEAAKCKSCGEVRNTPTGATTLLIRHLKEHSLLNGEYLRLQEEKKKIAERERGRKKNLKRLNERVVQFPLDPRGQKAQIITRAISLFICKGLQPYSVVEEPGFKYLVSVLEPRYVIPSRTTFSRKLIPNLYKDLKQKQQERLNEVRSILESVCFTTDIWTSKKMKAFLAFTLQFINEDFFLEGLTLECQPFPGSHDAAPICERMQDMVESTQLDDPQIKKYVITDNGSNMLAAFEQPSEERRLDEEIAEILRHDKAWEHRKCFNHTAQLAISDSKKDLGLNNVIDKVSNLVNRYSKSKNAKENLEKYQKEHGLPAHDLVQRVKTRWDSDFRMLERCVEQKKAVVSETSAAGEDNLTASEWKLAEGFVEVLRPVANHTAEMGSESGPTTSMILPVVFEIESELQDFIQNGPRGSGIQFARKVLGRAKSRFDQYRGDLTCIIAMLVDPRYKNLLENQHWPAPAKEILIQQAEEKYQSRVRRGLVEVQAATVPQRTMSEEEEPPLKRPRWRFLHSRRGQGDTPINDEAHARQIKEEVESYLMLPTIGAEEDPLGWWRVNQKTFPNLALVARHYLAIAATETASERVASVGSNTETSKRTNISAVHLKEMVFCHDNAEIPCFKPPLSIV